MERVRSKSGSESYVMVTSRGNGIVITRNEAVHERVCVMGIRGMSPIRRCKATKVNDTEVIQSGIGRGKG